MAKILVIEDERHVRENILELLKAENFSALGAENGRSGLQVAKKSFPDLILCDVMMPELDGYGVVACLREDPRTASIPFIFLTAKAERGDLRLGMELGADDYLTKPFTRTELLNAIRSRLAKHTAVAAKYTSEAKAAEEKLNHVIRHDPVTDLPNRQSLREHLSNLLAGSDGTAIALLYISLDRFERVDRLGSGLGDTLLKRTADRLASRINMDVDFAARVEGDHFAVVLTGLDQKQDAAILAEILGSTFQAAAVLQRAKIDPRNAMKNTRFKFNLPNEKIRQESALRLGRLYISAIVELEVESG